MSSLESAGGSAWGDIVGLHVGHALSDGWGCGGGGAGGGGGERCPLLSFRPPPFGFETRRVVAEKVGDSVGANVGASVGANVGASVGANVGASDGDSVGDLSPSLSPNGVGASVLY